MALASASPQQRGGGCYGHRPHRGHGDHERPQGVAGRVRSPVERLEDKDRAVKQNDERHADGRQCLPVHQARNDNPCPRIVLVMAAFFGFHNPNYSFPGVAPDRLFDRVLQNARAAEAAGFDLFTVMDHFYQIRGVGPETEPMLEAYMTLSAIAAQTSRIKLGTMVTGVTYRNPALLAKQVTALDVISKGRAILGIGAAWNEDEHRGYGFEFPPIRDRMDRLEEAVQIARLMFTQDRPSFEGKHYRIERALNVPRPIQQGGPKILIGGGGEKRTLRILAQYGDMGDWFGTGGIDDLKRKREVFLRHCEEVRRDPSEVLLLVGTFLVLVENEKEGHAVLERIPNERRAMVQALTVSQAAELVDEYLKAGFGGVRFSNQVLPTDEAIGRAGELIKLVNGSRVGA